MTRCYVSQEQSVSDNQPEAYQNFRVTEQTKPQRKEGSVYLLMLEFSSHSLFLLQNWSRFYLFYFQDFL